MADITKQRLAMWAILLFSGVFAGVGALCSCGAVNVATTVCDKPYVMHVVYALPGQDTKGDFSDPNLNVEDCHADEFQP